MLLLLMMMMTAISHTTHKQSWLLTGVRPLSSMCTLHNNEFNSNSFKISKTKHAGRQAG